MLRLGPVAGRDRLRGVRTDPGGGQRVRRRGLLTLVRRKRVVVRGRVQGVFFRDTVRRRANELGVSGWVRNRSDGAVEAVFEGDPEDVEEMVRVSRTGPEGAEVTEMELTSGEKPEGLTGFEVR